MPGITAGLFSHQLPVKIGKVVSQCKCHLTVVHILIPDIKSVFYIADGIAQPNIYSEWQHERGMKRVPHFDLVSVIQMIMLWPPGKCTEMVFKFKMSVHFMSNPCTRYTFTSPFVKVGKVHLLRTRSGSNSCTNHLALIGKSLPDHFTFVPDIKVPFGGSHTRVFQVGNLRIQRQFMFGCQCKSFNKADDISTVKLGLGHNIP